MGAVVLATGILPLLWISLRGSKVVWSRLLSAAQVVFILIAWFWVQHPIVIKTVKAENFLTVYNAAAPEATMLQLVIALAIGSCIILPFLYFLMKTFKGTQFVEN